MGCFHRGGNSGLVSQKDVLSWRADEAAAAVNDDLRPIQSTSAFSPMLQTSDGLGRYKMQPLARHNSKGDTLTIGHLFNLCICRSFTYLFAYLRNYARN